MSAGEQLGEREAHEHKEEEEGRADDEGEGLDEAAKTGISAELRENATERIGSTFRGLVVYG